MEPAAPRMSRAWIWIQLLVGWLPVWVLFTLLIVMAHEVPVVEAALVAMRLVVSAALLGLAVFRLTARWPWPHPFRLRFVALHLAAAVVFSLAWLALNSAIESALRGQIVITLGPGLAAMVTTGIWFYVMIAGVAYSQRAAQRTAQAQALEARSRLAALRAQLHPHFLFNALHTVVQLIPMDPRAAVGAAETLAGLLRGTIDEQRDLVPLADEWALVRRYLEIEKLRLGERLVVREAFAPDAMECTLPSFALQTLVENAVRHAAAPRVEMTTIAIDARCEGSGLVLVVSDDGPGLDPAATSAGTGLARLRERLAWLYGGSARLDLAAAPGHGAIATLLVPQSNA
jgi:signal transduction histidine kinase